VVVQSIVIRGKKRVSQERWVIRHTVKKNLLTHLTPTLPLALSLLPPRAPLQPSESLRFLVVLQRVYSFHAASTGTLASLMRETTHHAYFSTNLSGVLKTIVS
jgi:hypothetical protein